MPRRSVFTESEKQALLIIPTELPELSKYYLLSETEISLINQKRGKHNKLGFALLLCCMRYPGLSFDAETDIQPQTIKFIADQLKIKDFSVWHNYFKRDSTRREHILELQSLFGFKTFTNLHYQDYIKKLMPLVKQNDKGIIVANQLITLLHMDKIIVPSISVIERLCAEAITIGNQELYTDLTAPLTDKHILELNELLKPKPETRISNLHWLLQPATIPKPKHILLHIERLKLIGKLNLPNNIGKNVHQNRLIRIAKEGKNMPAGEILKFESTRRYATLVAVIIETKASIIDEIIELNDKILGNIFNKAKHSHNNEFQNSSKTINEKLNLYVKIGQILITAKQNNKDPFQAIEAVIPWDDFTKSVSDTKELAKPDSFDSLYKITAYYSWIKRYMIEFLEALEFKPSNSTTELFKALGIVKQMYHGKLRKVPDKAPTIFIKKQWHNLVFKDNGAIDKQFYEFSVLTELKNTLRSGDIWVVGSRKHKDFDEYLLDKEIKGLSRP